MQAFGRRMVGLNRNVHLGWWRRPSAPGRREPEVLSRLATDALVRKPLEVTHAQKRAARLGRRPHRVGLERSASWPHGDEHVDQAPARECLADDVRRRLQSGRIRGGREQHIPDAPPSREPRKLSEGVESWRQRHVELHEVAQDAEVAGDSAGEAAGERGQDRFVEMRRHQRQAHAPAGNAGRRSPLRDETNHLLESRNARSAPHAPPTPTV
jgi:hypothetical protein